MMWKSVCLASAAGLAALMSEATAQTPPRTVPPSTAPERPAAAAKPKQPSAALPDAEYEAARTAFESLPETTRKAVQDALVWTGDYNAVTAGTYGRRTYDGILAWQKRSGGEPSGILSARERAALDAGGEAVRKAMQFTILPDRASGAVIGVPERLLSKRSAQKGGTRWQSIDGRMTLDTKSFPAGETDLDTLFERATAVTPERRVTYKLKRPDFVVVTAETGAGRSYIRYASGPAGIRGFAIGYDKAMAGEAERLVIAVANSFLPFPEEVSAGAPTLATAPVPPIGTALPGFTARPAATGLAVATGRVLTTAAALESCANPQVGGLPLRQVNRDASGALALLALERGPQSGQPFRMPQIRTEVLASGEALFVLSSETRGAASVAPAIAGMGAVQAPLQPGAGGAPVLDRAGRLVGLVARYPNAPRLIAGVAPPTRYVTVPGAAIAAFLAEIGIPTAVSDRGGTGTLGSSAAPVIGAIVAIDCRS